MSEKKPRKPRKNLGAIVRKLEELHVEHERRIQELELELNMLKGRWTMNPPPNHTKKED